MKRAKSVELGKDMNRLTVGIEAYRKGSLFVPRIRTVTLPERDTVTVIILTNHPAFF